MSENKKRTLAEVTQEYNNTCAKAGHTQYQIFINKNDLSMINERLRELNLEAAAIKADEDAKAAAQPAKSE